jgi:hypothetical protein
MILSQTGRGPIYGRVMRRIVLCATTALLMLCATANAATPTSVAVDAHITPVIRQFTTKTTPASLSIKLTFSTDNGDYTAALTQAVLDFSYGAHLNGNLFPSCAPKTLQAGKSCPKGSLIGTGTGEGALADAVEPITLKLYNGPSGKSITFRIEGATPAHIDSAFAAPLETFSGGLYNYGLTVPVPEELHRIAGVDVSLHFLNVTVNAKRKVHGKTRGYIETLICPPGALVPMGLQFSFLEAPVFHSDDYIHCG